MEVVEEPREDGIVSNEEDEDECRICRLPGESENPLSYPCACRGTIKFVHQYCLLQWLNRRKISRCEVCKHVYSFVPLYAENAPTRLPLREFVVGMAFKATNVPRILLRIAYAVLVWLLLTPLVTSWVWQLAFVRSYSEAERLFRSHMSVSIIYADYVHGFKLSYVLVYVLFLFTFLRVLLTLVIRGLPGLANMNFARNGNDDDDAGGGQGIAGVCQIIRRNVERVVAWWEMYAARLLALHLGDWIENLNELIDMRAPLFHFDENAFAVLASNIIFIVVLVFVPFSLGRIVSFPLLWLFSYATSTALSSFMPQTESAFPLANITLKNAPSAFTFLSSNSQGNNMLSKVSDAVAHMINIDRTGLDRVSDSSTSPLSAHLFNGETARLPDDTTLLIGYLVIFSFVLIYLDTVFMMHLIMQRPFVITFIRETISSLARKFFEAIRQFTSMVHMHFSTVVKFAFILASKLGLLPLMYGWWLDVCTLRIFGQTIARRVESFAEHPVLTSFLHWIVGILYMIGFLFFVKFLEVVLNKGVFFFLWGRDNPNNNRFHRMIKAPVHKHVRRILLSIGIHGSLIVMLVYLPVKLVMRLAPSVFPLDLSFSASFDKKSVAAKFVDRFLFQFGIPCLARYFYLSATVRAFLHKWLTVVGSLLGLSDSLLPRPEYDGVQENRNAEPVRLRRQHNVQEVVLGIAEGSFVVTYAPGSMVIAEENSDAQADPRFALRIVLLLVLAWMTLLLFNSTMMTVPILLGRALHTSISHLPIISEIMFNDVYAFTVGSCIMRTALIIAWYAIEHVQTGRTVVLLNQIWEWISIALKSTALLLIWIFVIPILMGLLFDLMVIVPILVPLDESPIFTLFQDWVMGLVFLHIWAGLVLVDKLELFADRSWQVKLQRVLDDGLPRLHAPWVLQEILIPITMNLLTALSVPYVFTRGVFPMLGYPLMVNSVIHRFAWPSCFAFNFMWFFAKIIHVWVIYLHNSIRDDRYRIGKRLRNYGEDAEEKQDEM